MKENKTGELSGKYCSKLGANVLVLTGSGENGSERRMCLSSHLCGGEVHACSFSDQKENNKNKNTS